MKTASKWRNRFKALGDEEKSTEEILEIVPLKESLLGTKQQAVSGIHLTLGDLHVELDSGFDETTLKRKRPVRYMSGGRTNADRKLKNYFEMGFQNGGSRESI